MANKVKAGQKYRFVDGDGEVEVLEANLVLFGGIGPSESRRYEKLVIHKVRSEDGDENYMEDGFLNEYLEPMEG